MLTDEPKPGEIIRLVEWKARPGLQLLQARFHTRSFSRHSHEGFGFGVVEQGALGFFYRGENVVASAGRINTVNPDEVHTGHPATEQGWSYRMFYCSAEFVQAMAEAIAGRPVPLPFLTQGVIKDEHLATLMRQSHARLMNSRLPRLEQDSLLLPLLAALFARHTFAPAPPIQPGDERARIHRVIDFLEAYFAEDVDLDTLSAIACLSPYHFIRVFARQTGLTPHAWLMQVRVRKASVLVRQGVPLADVAVQAGFSDQSHLNRNFRRFLGYTPGQLRNSVQDA